MKLKYNAQVTYKTVETVIAEATKDKNPIDLDAPYQRGVVWSDTKMGEFINSIILGIIPNNILLNSSVDEREQRIVTVCLDGKQRITSLIKFYKNEIFVKMDGDKKIYWFDTIHDDYADDTNCEVLSKLDRMLFLNRNLLIIQYNELNYVEQIDIFRRIQNGEKLSPGDQNGEKLSPGELIASLLEYHDICEAYNQFCETKKKNLECLTKTIGRKKHLDAITKIMYMINEKKLKIPDRTTRRKYIKNIKSKKLLTKYLNNIDGVIDICCSDDVFNHTSIQTLNINTNLYMVLIYMIYVQYIYMTDIQSNNYKNIRHIIKKTYKKYKRDNVSTGTSKATLHQIQKIFNRYYDAL